MTTSKEVLRFELERYEDVEEFAYSEEMFWDDLTLYQDTSLVIYNANQGTWYDIEPRYHYADIRYLIEENKVVEFRLLDDKELEEELTEYFLGE